MLEIRTISFILAVRAWILNEDQGLSAGCSSLVDIARGEHRNDATEDMIWDLTQGSDRS